MAFIFPLPGRSRTLCDRLFASFQAYLVGTKWAADARPKGFTRRTFFDPFLSFDPTTLEPRCLSRRRSLSLVPKKWSAQLSYFATMTEMDRRHKRSSRIFFKPPRAA